MRVEVFTAVSAFQDLRAEWYQLLSQLPFQSVFFTPQWQETWWRHFGATRPLHLLTVRASDGTLQGLAPLMSSPGIDGTSRLELLGDQELCDYCDVLMVPAQQHAVGRALVEYLVDNAGDEMEVCLQNLSQHSSTPAVFQDYLRYELPLRDNVAPGGAPDADILASLSDARADGLAELDTVLSRAYAGGRDLSGGQWQRVALARALCAVRLGAGVVVLDEPTAQLDVRGELEIFERLLDATRGATTILVSHRFSTVRRADRICVVEAGRVVEIGTHEELIERDGRYRTMFELQASRFEDGDVDDGAEVSLEEPA